MDLNGDGHDDVLSGSYSPGDLYVFYGTPGGGFSAGEILKDAEGKNLNVGGPRKWEDRPASDGLAPSPFAFDADGDGLLDLYVGNLQGYVFLIPNEGTPTKPVFNAQKKRKLECDGQPIKVRGDAGPCVADWDGDGKPDLLVGSADGSVWFYRNIGTRTAARYAPGIAIVPQSEMSFGNPVKHGAAPDRPGIRTKVCVVDWNGDGRPDLLVGDLWYEHSAGADLTPENKRRLEELRTTIGTLSEEIQALLDKQDDRSITGSARKSLTDQVVKLVEQRDTLAREREALAPSPAYHGSVWLYLRTAK